MAAGRGAMNQDFVQTVESEEQFAELVEASETKCIVIDCHQDWCGRVDTLQPTWTRMFLDNENADQRLAVYSASVNSFGAQMQQLCDSSDQKINFEEGGCMPVFLIVRFKQVVGLVKGVNSPAILQHVAMNIPDVKEDDEA